MVDALHLVQVFSVEYGWPIVRRGVPRRLVKHSDVEKYAPYKAACLKLATLRHYREQHRDLEGTWDPMEGRSRVASTLEEMCRLSRARDNAGGGVLAVAQFVCSVPRYLGPLLKFDSTHPAETPGTAFFRKQRKQE